MASTGGGEDGATMAAEEASYGCLFPLISGFSAKIIERILGQNNRGSYPIFSLIWKRLSEKRRIHMNFTFFQRGMRIERLLLAYPRLCPSIAHPRILSSRRRRPSLLWIRAGASYPPRA